MKKFLEKIKREINLRKSILRSRSASNGMTYVELIVVLSIFSVMSAIVLYNYQAFQAKVDIKNLASDIALKIVEAQKSSSNGLLPPPSFSITEDWKPSYGVYFNADPSSTAKDTDGVEYKRKFIYFTDTAPVLQNSFYDDALGFCQNIGSNECLDKITIAKNDYIEKIEKCSVSPCGTGELQSSLSITFKRTDSGATFKDSSGTPLTLTGSQYIQITVMSANGGAKALIKVYSSGRVQVN